MASDIPFSDIEGWIDDRIVEDVEQVPDANADYNFAVTFSGMPIHVVSSHGEDGIMIAGQAVPSGDVKEVFRELSENDRDHLLARIQETLNDSRGVYRFQTADGADCEFGDLHHIRIEHRIYPDGASQHELMNSIFDVAKSLLFLQESISTLTKNVQNRR